MKNIKYLLILVIFQFACNKTDDLTNLNYGVNPFEELELANAGLKVGERAVLIEGEIPEYQNTGDQLSLSGYPDKVEISAGVLLFFEFTTNDNENLCDIFLQIEGATSYWKSEVEFSGDQPFVKVLIPNFIQNGNFDLQFTIESCGGAITETGSVNTIVTEPLRCESSFSGTLGITVIDVDLGNGKGTAAVNYQAYRVKDRFDIRYDNKWVGSTGKIIGQNEIPSCRVTDGFVSGEGKLTFEYDGKKNSQVTVYAYGCRDGTEWDVSFECP